MNASFEEKSVWVQLASLVIALGSYTVTASRMMAAGVSELSAYATVFAGSILLLVAVIVAGHIALAIVNRDQSSDERDRIITWRAESHTAWIMAFGIITSLGALVTGTELLWVAHGLLFSLYLSEIAAFALRIFYYRRGLPA